MKVVILAGGFGTRISEESHLRPKPMIEIGDKPLLWHIMKNFSEQGFNEFIIAAGYKQEMIKQWFFNRAWYSNDITITHNEQGYPHVEINRKRDGADPWKVTIVDTGLNTQTGGRIGRLREYIGDEPFIVTYGDGVSNIDMNAVVALHKETGRQATISTYNYQQNKGVVEVYGNEVIAFREKSAEDGQVINIGYMVFEPDVLELLANDATVLEKDCLTYLAANGQLTAYHHRDFWQCMDTIREKQILEKYWSEGNAPWKNWEG